jgi:Uma2 family endonuclease
MKDFYTASELRYSGRALMSDNLQRKLFTAEDCYRMSEAGILLPEDRVELIRGEILKMSPIGPRHGASVDGANKVMVRLAGDHAIVRIQGTVELDQFCAPQPDVVLLRPRDDFYVGKNPAGRDILLIIEVADLSLEYDTTVKVELYSILGVHEYWVADLQNDSVIVYSDPAESSYKTVREFRSGDTLTPQLLPECAIKAAVLLP